MVALKTPLFAGKVAEREVLMDMLYHPEGRVVVDYRTAISGITAELLAGENVVTDFAVVQQQLLSLISEQCVLVGHGLSHDLKALKLVHKRVIDTGLIFTSPLKHQMLGLRDVVKHVFSQDCQPENQPHNSIHDAGWPLELVRKVIDGADAEEDSGKRTRKLVELLAQPLPPHFHRRIQVFQIMEGASLGDVLQVFNIPKTAKFQAPPVQFRSHDGKKPLGSVVLKFAKPEDATRVFQLLTLKDMKTDKDGIYQKKCFLDAKKFPKGRHFFAKAYCEPGSGPPAKTPTKSAAEVKAPSAKKQKKQKTPAKEKAAASPAPAAATAAASPGVKKFCSNCGAKVGGGSTAKFCTSCGTPLK